MTSLVPLDGAEFEAYLKELIPAFAADKVASGQWSESEALELSRRSVAELLPFGTKTPGHHFFTVRDGAKMVDVGVLWFAVQERAGAKIAYVYDIMIKPEHRRRGHASRAFGALEEKVRDLRLSGIALHVFGHNEAARALYAKLGYRATNLNLYKEIGRL